jgi:hypothetical protein
MAAAYRADSEIASASERAADGRVFLRPPSRLIEQVLSSSIPDQKKLVEVRKMVAGSLYPMKWSTVVRLLKHPLLADKREWITEAKKMTLCSCVGADPEYAKEMLRDPEVQALQNSAEVRAARERWTEAQEEMARERTEEGETEARNARIEWCE